MLTISKMKSLIITPTTAAAVMSPMSKSTTPPFASLFFLSHSKPTTTIITNSSLLQNPILSLPIKPTILPLNNIKRRSFNSKAGSDSQQPPSGEIHVIVGPMFAGKTTTLLRRVQAERDSGSFQVRHSLKMDRTLKSLCVSGRMSEAVGLLWRMGTEVDDGTYALLLQECIFWKQFRRGRLLHAQMVVVGYVPNEYLKTKLLILYAKSGDLRTMHLLFDKLVEKTIISWNAMIGGYVQKGLQELGLSLYYKMRQNGLIPDQYTFASVFRACATLATLEHGKQAHGVMVKCNLRENVVVTSALMDMYFKCSNASDGHKVFDKLINRNVVTWTSLISGYGQHGRVTEVFELFDKMKHEGFRPNYVTFLTALSACSHSGLVDKGWEYFASMKRDYGIQPRDKHYAAMVDILGRCGRLQEAYEFVLNSPCKDHSTAWGALLGACRIHGNMDLVKLVARKYFELDPENAGQYVVLSNAYATVDSWENVAAVRGMMRDSRIMKEPSYSKIEVQGEVHLFLLGDKSHSKFEEIQNTIVDMACMLKDAGDVLDLSNL